MSIANAIVCCMQSNHGMQIVVPHTLYSYTPQPFSGNFAGQPALKAIGLDIQKDEFPKAEHLGTHGFFIGLHVTPLAPETISDLVEIMMDFDFAAQDDGESKQGDAKRAKKA